MSDYAHASRGISAPSASVCACMLPLHGAFACCLCIIDSVGSRALGQLAALTDRLMRDEADGAWHVDVVQRKRLLATTPRTVEQHHSQHHPSTGTLAGSRTKGISKLPLSVCAHMPSRHMLCPVARRSALRKSSPPACLLLLLALATYTHVYTHTHTHTHTRMHTQHTPHARTHTHTHTHACTHAKQPALPPVLSRPRAHVRATRTRSVGDVVGEGTAAHLEDRLPAATNTHVPTYSNKHTPACPQQ
jgi:hypothetical protein